MKTSPSNTIRTDLVTVALWIGINLVRSISVECLQYLSTLQIQPQPRPACTIQQSYSIYDLVK